MAMSRKTMIATALGATLVLGGGVAIAQQRSGWGPMGWHMSEGRGGFGPMMMGARLCGAKEPLAPTITGRLESTLKPTAEQKAEFDALKAAMEKAAAGLKAACPSQAERDDRTPPARLALTEKTMAAHLEALRTVKEPFNALYAKLDTKQRDQLRWMERRGRDGERRRGGHMGEHMGQGR